MNNHADVDGALLNCIRSSRRHPRKHHSERQWSLFDVPRLSHAFSLSAAAMICETAARALRGRSAILCATKIKKVVPMVEECISRIGRDKHDRVVVIDSCPLFVAATRVALSRLNENRKVGQAHLGRTIAQIAISSSALTLFRDTTEKSEHRTSNVPESPCEFAR
jgi:hypothetical protein